MKDLEEDFTPLVNEHNEDRRWEVWEPPTEYPENRVWTVVVLAKLDAVAGRVLR